MMRKNGGIKGRRNLSVKLVHIVSIIFLQYCVDKRLSTGVCLMVFFLRTYLFLSFVICSFFLHITLKYNTNLDSLTLYIYIYVSSYFFLHFFFVFYSFLLMYSAMIVRTVSHRQAFRRVPNSILTCSHFAFIN